MAMETKVIWFKTLKLQVSLVTLVMLASPVLRAQTTIEFESFEGTASELGYTADEFSNGVSNYFARISNTNGGTGAITYHIYAGVPANIHDDGSGDKYFFGIDDGNDPGNPRVDALGLMTLNTYTDLKLTIALTQGSSLRFETSDYIRIYYAFDSDTSSHPSTSTTFSVGSYTLLAEFKTSGSAMDLSQDGLGVTTLSTGSFDDYTFSCRNFHYNPNQCSLQWS